MFRNRVLKPVFSPIKRVCAVCSNPNVFRYWIHKKTGIKFTPKAADFPPMVFLEPANYCNFLCVHCAYKSVSRNPKYKQGYMSFKLFAKIVDEVSQHKNTVLRPFDRGEALLNEKLPEMIKYAKEKGIKNVWLNTNGVFLTKQKSIKLLRSGLDQIEVSIDAFAESTYSKIKGVDGKILNEVARNTAEYYRLKKKLYPTDQNKKLIVSFVESSINTLEKNDFVAFWRNHADFIRIRPVHQHGALVENMRVREKSRRIKRLPCSILWERVSIDYSGNLRFCEVDWENKGVMGSVKTSSIKEIWQSKGYEELRKCHVDGNFSKIQLCRICESYQEAGGW